MHLIFGDTSYWAAILLPRDTYHRIAREVTERTLPSSRIVTSEFVIVETLNYLSRRDVRLRNEAFALLAGLRTDPNIDVVKPSDKLFAEAGKLYLKHSDKSWSFTDCASVAIMREFGIREALTSDHHFEQAGFRALLI